MNRSILTTAIVAAILLTACGGGGGGGNNFRAEAPPPAPAPTPAPPPAPAPAPAPTSPPPSSAPSVAERYGGVADNTLVPINADLAHRAGITGAGIRVGLLDDPQYPAYETLKGQVAFYQDFTGHDDAPEPESNDKRGHGALMGATIAGRPVTGFNGGVAPDADLYWGRICYDNKCGSRATADAVSAMVGKGVRLFNLSIGSFPANETDRINSARAWGQALAPAVRADGLVIVAAGNDGRDNIGYPAGAPHEESWLRDNWLAAAALAIDTDGSPAGLASYSNWCGDAAQWCLAAPGLHRLPALEGTTWQYGAQGTSNSAAVISGVAALVQQAFPWMGGHALQQTLLTTATDLGAAGVDAMYGWGMVNADKAIRGPARFVDDFSANVTGASVFSNDIDGGGGLVKGGPGWLLLDGRNTFAGDTVVNAGVLGFGGDTVSGVVVNSGGTYSAQGGRIGGDYTAHAGATTQVQLGNPLQVGGSAALGGALQLLAEGEGYTVAATENLLTAARVGGTFDSVTYGNGFFWDARLAYTDTTVDAAMTRAQAQPSAQAAGASAAVVDGAGQADVLVGALDDAVATGQTAGLEPVMDAAAGLMRAPAGTAAASLASLTGQVHGVQRTLGVQGVMNDARALADRLPELAGTTAPTGWASLTRFDGDLARDGYPTADYRQDAVALGMDLPLGDAVVGWSLSRGTLRSGVDAGSDQLDSRHVGGSVHAVKPLGDGYVSAVAGYQRGDVETRRTVLAGDTVDRVGADRDESAWHARLEAGVDVGRGLTPFLGAGAVVHRQAAFSETGSSGLGLGAGADTVTAPYADLGLRHRHAAGDWTFDSVLAWRTLVGDVDTGYRAWFTGMPAASFMVNGQPLPDDAWRAALGIGYRFSPTLSVHGDAGVERASEGEDNASAAIGLRWEF